MINGSVILLLFGGPTIIAGPYAAVAGDSHQPGAAAGDNHAGGAQRTDEYVAGAVEVGTSLE